MGDSGERSGYFTRNADILALTLIVLFGGIGSAIAQRVNNVPWERFVPMVDSIKPRIIQIREAESRRIREESRQVADESRRIVEESRRIKEESRQQMHQVRDELRQQFREMFRNRDNGRFE